MAQDFFFNSFPHSPDFKDPHGKHLMITTLEKKKMLVTRTVSFSTVFPTI